MPLAATLPALPPAFVGHGTTSNNPILHAHDERTGVENAIFSRKRRVEPKRWSEIDFSSGRE